MRLKHCIINEIISSSGCDEKVSWGYVQRQDLKMWRRKKAGCCQRLWIFQPQRRIDFVFLISTPPHSFMRSLTLVYLLHNGSIIRNMSVKEFPPLCKVRVEPYFWESWYTHRDLEIVRLRETRREKNMTVSGDRGTQLELKGSGGRRGGTNAMTSWETFPLCITRDGNRPFLETAGWPGKLASNWCPLVKPRGLYAPLKCFWVRRPQSASRTLRFWAPCLQ